MISYELFDAADFSLVSVALKEWYISFDAECSLYEMKTLQIEN